MISARRIQTGESRFYGFDPMGNTCLLADSNGNVTDRYNYKAFGEELSGSGSTPNPYRFGGEVGYYRDKIERVYIRARHYAPDTGRWLSRDPLGFAGGDFNLYRYVENNPVNLIDPSGQAIPILYGIWVLIGGALVLIQGCGRPPSQPTPQPTPRPTPTPPPRRRGCDNPIFTAIPACSRVCQEAREHGAAQGSSPADCCEELLSRSNRFPGDVGLTFPGTATGDWNLANCITALCKHVRCESF